jgi:kynurenine 3-monooxygenase
VVTVRGADDEAVCLRPTLLVGADGLKSIVRRRLRDWAEAGVTSPSPSFAMRKRPSPAAGLRYKVLQLPARFVLDAVACTSSEAGLGYVITSVDKSSRHTMRLGMLPIRDPDAPRTANLITRADHPVWNVLSLVSPPWPR